MRRVALLVAAALLGGTAAATATPTHAASTASTASTASFSTVQRSYGPAADQRLTVYVPPTRSPRPAILFVHGGCWQRSWVAAGESTAAQQIAQASGFVVAVMSYRVDEPLYTVQPADVAAAYRSLQTGPFPIDRSRIAVWGESSGAHLALLHAYRATGADRPAAVVSVSGPTDMRTAYASTLASCVAAFEGGPPRSKTLIARYAQTSPVSFVDRGDPPTFIAHALRDPTVPYAQSVELAQTLRTAGVPFTSVALAGANHATAAEYATPIGGRAPVYELAVAFLRRHLG